jgi:hypothetical protein
MSHILVRSGFRHQNTRLQGCAIAVCGHMLIRISAATVSDPGLTMEGRRGVGAWHFSLLLLLALPLSVRSHAVDEACVHHVNSETYFHL